MLRKLLVTVVVGTAPLTLPFVAGCTSSGSDKPYALTGDRSTTTSDVERKERMRWTDDKGRYRSDLRLAGGAPLRYVP
jgi:hypothetical protein